MEDEATSPDLTGLRASVSNFVWLADLGLRKQDRLNTHEAEAMRRAREDLNVDLRRLQKVLLNISPLATAEAFEIEECVARLLRNAGLICAHASATEEETNSGSP